MAVGAGFLLSVVFFEAVPRTVGELSESFALWFLGGYLVIHLVEHTWVEHFHFGEEVHADEVKETRSGSAASIGLAIHAFFDGFSITAASQFSLAVGALMFVAIALHKLPEGFTVASLNLAAGRSQKTALWWAGLLGIATLLGAMISGFLHAYPAEILAFSGGVALYVAASDLMPEVNRFPGIRTPVSVFFGVLFFYLTERFLHHLLVG
jgi:ZIP family zinc transporter/zinc and cadmium transporter